MQLHHLIYSSLSWGAPTDQLDHQFSAVIYRLWRRYLPVVAPLFTGCGAVIYRLSRSYLPVVAPLFTGCGAVIYRLWRSYLPVVAQLFTGCGAVIYRLWPAIKRGRMPSAPSVGSGNETMPAIGPNVGLIIERQRQQISSTSHPSLTTAKHLFALSKIQNAIKYPRCWTPPFFRPSWSHVWLY